MLLPLPPSRDVGRGSEVAGGLESALRWGMGDLLSKSSGVFCDLRMILASFNACVLYPVWSSPERLQDLQNGCWSNVQLEQFKYLGQSDGVLW